MCKGPEAGRSACCLAGQIPLAHWPLCWRVKWPRGSAGCMPCPLDGRGSRPRRDPDALPLPPGPCEVPGATWEPPQPPPDLGSAQACRDLPAAMLASGLGGVGAAVPGRGGSQRPVRPRSMDGAPGTPLTPRAPLHRPSSPSFPRRLLLLQTGSYKSASAPWVLFEINEVTHPWEEEGTVAAVADSPSAPHPFLLPRGHNLTGWHRLPLWLCQEDLDPGDSPGHRAGL